MKKYEFKNNNLTIIDQDLNLNLISDLEVDEEKSFYSDGSLKSLCYHHKGQLHGPSVFYSKIGKPLTESWFYLGKKNGQEIYYYLSSKIYSCQKYIDDKCHGLQKFYYENGSLKSIINYKNGLLHNETKLFYENAKLKRYSLFKEGKMIKDQIFSEDEKLIDESEFEL